LKDNSRTIIILKFNIFTAITALPGSQRHMLLNSASGAVLMQI